MCEHCSGFATERFFSHQDFAAFEKAFEKKCLDGTFIRVVNSNQIAQDTSETTFECTHCNTDWVLSTPENDWQGYFLRENQLVAYDNYEYESTNNNTTFRANFKGQKGNCGCCLAIFLGLLALIIYIIYSVFDFILDMLF
ncbi:hypothetical protein [Kordia sp.]|uniref:hypothetical protein n=1 Tax=Kordia sp. TaxID=1965332 RepID=UPI0025C2A2F9|nr:hypothetical protein [Kordia sp.]MCH2194613.1 hypothetical protein [Kordia sp.]